MKKSIQQLVTQLAMTNNGNTTGDFGVLRGGASLTLPANQDCTNSIICSGKNTGVCTNLHICNTTNDASCTHSSCT